MICCTGWSRTTGATGAAGASAGLVAAPGKAGSCTGNVTAGAPVVVEGRAAGGGLRLNALGDGIATDCSAASSWASRAVTLAVSQVAPARGDALAGGRARGGGSPAHGAAPPWSASAAPGDA